MSIIGKALIHTAILWPDPVPDQYGSFTFGDPVEIKCRWTSKQEEIVDTEGQTFVSTAMVMVDRDVDTNSYIMLGELDSTTPASPIGVDGAWQVRSFKAVPFPLSGRETYRAVYL